MNTIAEAYTLQDAREFWDYNMLGDKIYFDIEHLFIKICSIG